MPIGIIFQFGSELVEVRINNENVLFRTKTFRSQFATIEGLKLDYRGVCREFPDLELREDWNKEAINRFKEKIKSFNTEEERMNYIVNDLRKFGYVPLYKQKNGFRIEKWKD